MISRPLRLSNGPVSRFDRATGPFAAIGVNYNCRTGCNNSSARQIPVKTVSASPEYNAVPQFEDSSAKAFILMDRAELREVRYRA